MSTDSLRFNDWGQPVGLNWDAISPPKPEAPVLTQNSKPRKAKKKGKKK